MDWNIASDAANISPLHCIILYLCHIKYTTKYGHVKTIGNKTGFDTIIVDHEKPTNCDDCTRELFIAKTQWMSILRTSIHFQYNRVNMYSITIKRAFNHFILLWIQTVHK